MTLGVDSDLLFSNNATNGTLRTGRKTSLGTGSCLAGDIFLGMTGRSNLLGLGVATYGTGELSLTGLGTSSLLSYLGSAVSVLCTLGLGVVRIGLAALTLTFYEVMLVGSHIVGVSLATLAGAINESMLMLGLGLIFSGNDLIDKIAGCKSKYHCDHEKYTRQKIEMSLHDKEPPFVFLFQ